MSGKERQRRKVEIERGDRSRNVGIKHALQLVSKRGRRNGNVEPKVEAET